MQIYPINSINFKAKQIREVPILKKTNHNDYEEVFANLLEFDITNSADMEKIREISELPGFSLYGYEIYQGLCSNGVKSFTRHCYALMDVAEDDASKINNDNVLGLFTIREMHDNRQPDEIALFITNKQFRTRWYREERENKFYHVGEGMADALTSIFSKKSIKCFSEVGAVRFWEKFGFKEFTDRNLILKR